MNEKIKLAISQYTIEILISVLNKQNPELVSQKVFELTSHIETIIEQFDIDKTTTINDITFGEEGKIEEKS